MSNTEHTEELAEFYRERILSLAERAAKRGIESFPVRGDALADSYFTERSDNETYIHTIGNIRDDLNELWAGDKIPEMAEIARPLMKIAEMLREREQASDEVSPFIYAMF
jgi:hypothetical protein